MLLGRQFSRHLPDSERPLRIRDFDYTFSSPHYFQHSSTHNPEDRCRRRFRCPRVLAGTRIGAPFGCCLRTRSQARKVTREVRHSDVRERIWIRGWSFLIMQQYTYSFEQDSFEMQEDAIKPGQVIIVVDDLIATGKSVLYM